MRAGIGGALSVGSKGGSEEGTVDGSFPSGKVSGGQSVYNSKSFLISAIGRLGVGFSDLGSLDSAAILVRLEGEGEGI